METSESILSAPLLHLGSQSLSVGMVLAGMAGLMVLALLLLLIGRFRGESARQLLAAEAEFRAREAEARLAEIQRGQSEMQGRIAAMAELFGARQQALNQDIGQRLDGLSQRLGSSIGEQTKATHENLARLQERLAVIDTAQSNIQALARDVVGLQAILSNKQTRGAFGQSRMETIVADGLPMGAYEFQATLSSGTRPDCIIRMPNGQAPLVIDAKFPLEAWNAMREAAGVEALREATARFRRDIEGHLKDIAEKYLLRGETQDTAFMFVPSESIFAEIHEKHEGVIQKAHRLRVVLVSPSLLMLSIQVIQSVLKDARMREQAHLIQGEVTRLMEDMGRLDERVRKLQGHFSMAQKDVEDIVVSAGKIARRGDRIEAMEFGPLQDPPAVDAVPHAGQARPGVDSKTGQLKFRVVDED